MTTFYRTSYVLHKILSFASNCPVSGTTRRPVSYHFSHLSVISGYEPIATRSLEVPCLQDHNVAKYQACDGQQGKNIELKLWCSTYWSTQQQIHIVLQPPTQTTVAHCWTSTSVARQIKKALRTLRTKARTSLQTSPMSRENIHVPCSHRSLSKALHWDSQNITRNIRDKTTSIDDFWDYHISHRQRHTKSNAGGLQKHTFIHASH